MQQIRNMHRVTNPCHRGLLAHTMWYILFNVNTSFRRHNDKMHYHFKVHSSFSLHIRIHNPILPSRKPCMQSGCYVHVCMWANVIQFMQCASVWFDSLFVFFFIIYFIASLSTNFNWMCMCVCVWQVEERQIENRGKGIKTNQGIWMDKK